MNEKMIWTPPTLSAPIPPKDYVYRWARLETFNLKYKKRKFVSFVRLNKLKHKKRYPWIYIKKFGKCVGIEGLALIKIKISNLNKYTKGLK
jgi:hypothetical protein